MINRQKASRFVSSESAQS